MRDRREKTRTASSPGRHAVRPRTQRSRRSTPTHHLPTLKASLTARRQGRRRAKRRWPTHKERQAYNEARPTWRSSRRAWQHLTAQVLEMVKKAVVGLLTPLRSDVFALEHGQKTMEKQVSHLRQEVWVSRTTLDAAQATVASPDGPITSITKACEGFALRQESGGLPHSKGGSGRQHPAQSAHVA